MSSRWHLLLIATRLLLLLLLLLAEWRRRTLITPARTRRHWYQRRARPAARTTVLHLTLLLIGQPGVILPSIVTTPRLAAAYRRRLFLLPTDGHGLAVQPSAHVGWDQTAADVTLYFQGALGGRAHLTISADRATDATRRTIATVIFGCYWNKFATCTSDSPSIYHIIPLILGSTEADDLAHLHNELRRSNQVRQETVCILRVKSRPGREAVAAMS